MPNNSIPIVFPISTSFTTPDYVVGKNIYNNLNSLPVPVPEEIADEATEFIDATPIRNVEFWHSGVTTLYNYANIPLFQQEISGQITIKNSGGTTILTLSSIGDLTHPKDLSTGGDATIDGDTLLKGTLNVQDVTTFEIPNPTSPGSFLNHGALQGREHALYFRGTSSSTTITLPTTWGSLVDETTITVHLTPSALVPVPNYMVDVYLAVPTVVSISSTTVTVWNPYALQFHYLIIGKRKDVPNA